MRVTILGCGPSAGVPLLGCDCAVCRSDNPKNQRLRPSVLVESGETRILVDATPDLRAQLLRAAVWRVDAVLFTHEHADHTHGIDELRSINHHNDAVLDVYGDGRTLASLGERFAYAFEGNEPGRGWSKPHLVAREIQGPFRIGEIAVTPFVQGHGPGTTLGFRFGAAAYSSDVNALSDEAFAALDGLDVWILDCLRRTPNIMHSHLQQSLDWIGRVRPRRAVLTHMNHDLDYDALRSELPPGIEPAYDGMIIEIAD